MPPAVRIYAHDLHPNRQPGERTDFTETLYWCAGVKTHEKTGVAKVSFKLNDAVTSFKVTADGFAASGALGEASTTIKSVQPFYVESKMPLDRNFSQAMPWMCTVSTPCDFATSDEAILSRLNVFQW